LVLRGIRLVFGDDLFELCFDARPILRMGKFDQFPDFLVEPCNIARVSLQDGDLLMGIRTTPSQKDPRSPPFPEYGGDGKAESLRGGFEKSKGKFDRPSA
jgi:hypothetical protein